MNSPNTQWLESNSDRPHGSFILIHGLNNKAESLIPIGRFLNSLGYHSLLLSLSGHNNNGCDTIGASAWNDDLSKAIEEARERFPNLPIQALGYSLGAVLLASSLSNLGENQVSRLVFIAPPFTPARHTALVKALTPLKSFGISLPSFAPENYRCAPRTSLAAYAALFHLIKESKKEVNIKTLRTVPTLCILNPRDHLLDNRLFKRWHSKNALQEMQLKYITPDHNHSVAQLHLMIDEQNLGSKGWEELQTAITEFLSN